MNSRTLVLLLIGTFVAPACEKAQRFEDDDVYPAKIEDLSCEGTAGDTVQCTWKAVGDDGMDGRAARYWIFRHDARIEISNLDQVVLVTDTMQPAEPGAVESHDVTGLEPDTGYWFAVSVADDAGNSTLSNSDDGKTLDSVPPEPVPELQAEVVPTGDALLLTWTLPADTADLTGVLVVSKQGAAPADASDGAPVCDSDPASQHQACYSATSHEDSGLTDGVEYHYAAFAHDEVPNYAAPARDSAVPTDTVPPDPLLSFSANDPGTGTSVQLLWELPLDDTDLAGVLVLRREDDFPETPDDVQASVVYDGPAQTGTDDYVVTLGNTYYYAAYTHDDTPNHSDGLTAQVYVGVRPVTGFDVSDPGLGNRLDLSWVNSDTESVNFVLVLRFVGTCVDDPYPAQFDRKKNLPVSAAGQPQVWTDDQVADDVEYCYAAFAKSGVNYSPAAFATGTSTDVTPPQAVSGFTVTPSTTPGDLAMDLSWTNPQDSDLMRVLILRRAGTYPESPADAEALVVHDGDGLSESCRDEGVDDGVEYMYRTWAFDEVPLQSAPADATATRYIDDDQDGYSEDQNDCDDNDALFYPGAPPQDCSDTDWACDGQVWVDAWCVDNAPAWLDPQCATGPPTCDEGPGCEWYEGQDHTTCTVMTDPEYSYDICVEGGCLSPGSCGDATCNSPGPHFIMSPAAGHAEFTRTADPEPVVTDNATGLMWQGCAAGLSGSDCATGGAAPYTWQNALAHCDGLSWAGHDDWRLPDSHELQSIVDYGSIGPAIDQGAFPLTPSSFFWSSSSYAADSSHAWFVHFNAGLVFDIDKDDDNYVRCVRSGP